ncbi:MAG: hypothetical protein LUE87_09330 [Lachnospiraceae bacterium]|nr:hypothetical protein [Lachnospiraceae bacterium]
MLSAVVILFLAGLSVCDIREKSLPLWLLLAGGVVLGGMSLLKNGPAAVLAGGIPGMILLLLAVAWPQSLGTGDGLTVLAVGLAWGFGTCCQWLLLGFLIAAVVSLWKMVVRKENGKEQMALIPFLFLAAIGESLL